MQCNNLKWIIGIQFWVNSCLGIAAQCRYLIVNHTYYCVSLTRGAVKIECC